MDQHAATAKDDLRDRAERVVIPWHEIERIPLPTSETRSRQSFAVSRRPSPHTVRNRSGGAACSGEHGATTGRLRNTNPLP